MVWLFYRHCSARENKSTDSNIQSYCLVYERHRKQGSRGCGALFFPDRVGEKKGLYRIQMEYRIIKEEWFADLCIQGDTDERQNT